MNWQELRLLVKCHKFNEKAIKDGFIRLTDSKDPLWRMYRGLGWHNKIITEVIVSPDRRHVWAKIGDEDQL